MLWCLIFICRIDYTVEWTWDQPCDTTDGYLGCYVEDTRGIIADYDSDVFGVTAQVRGWFGPVTFTMEMIQCELYTGYGLIPRIRNIYQQQRWKAEDFREAPKQSLSTIAHVSPFCNQVAYRYDPLIIATQ